MKGGKMSIRDRLRQMEAEGKLDNRSATKTTDSLTLADPPVITRARQLLDGMLSSFKKNGGPHTKYLWMLEAFANEGIEEMRDAMAANPDAMEIMARWFTEISMLFEWVGTGNIRGDLPDWMTPPQKEIESASVGPGAETR